MQQTLHFVPLVFCFWKQVLNARARNWPLPKIEGPWTRYDDQKCRESGAQAAHQINHVFLGTMWRLKRFVMTDGSSKVEGWGWNPSLFSCYCSYYVKGGGNADGVEKRTLKEKPLLAKLPRKCLHACRANYFPADRRAYHCLKKSLDLKVQLIQPQRISASTTVQVPAQNILGSFRVTP